MSRVYPSSMMFKELEEILNDSVTIIFLNGKDYPKNCHNKMIDSMVLQGKTLNHIVNEYKGTVEGSLLVFYDCGNQFESDLAVMIRKELREYWDHTYLLGVKNGSMEYTMIYPYSFKITMNKKEHIHSEYCCYFESKNQYKEDISIDKNKSGYCIIDDGIKRDPWSRDKELISIGRTEVLEYLMDKYNVKVKSYYMWLEDKNKKIGDIHPGPEGKTSELTHHYHLFQERHQDVGYIYFY
jgi:hypothetical protein